METINSCKANVKQKSKLLKACTRHGSVMGMLNVKSHNWVPYRVKYQCGTWNMEYSKNKFVVVRN